VPLVSFKETSKAGNNKKFHFAGINSRHRVLPSSFGALLITHRLPELYYKDYNGLSFPDNFQALPSAL
jgi:hypothetical protein